MKSILKQWKSIIVFLWMVFISIQVLEIQNNIESVDHQLEYVNYKLTGGDIMFEIPIFGSSIASQLDNIESMVGEIYYKLD
jgi:hypothetical protein